MKTTLVLVLSLLALAAAISPPTHRFRQQSKTREPCADILDPNKPADEDTEKGWFVECNLPNAEANRAGKEITTPAGVKFKYTQEAQLAQGGFKRLYVAKITATKEGYPEVDKEVVIAVSKLSVEAAFDQLKAEYDGYATHKGTVGACPGVMKIYEGWTVGDEGQRQSFYMIFEKVAGKGGKANTAKYFATDRLTLKEWAKVTKQMFETWSCVIGHGKYISDSDMKNMMINTDTDYRLIDLDIKALDVDENEIKYRRFVLQTSLRFGGAKRDCWVNWKTSDTGNKFIPACEGVITKATELQAGKIKVMYETAQTTVSGLTGAAATDVLVDGSLNNDAIDAGVWTKVA
jgi:hypothetical protein